MCKWCEHKCTRNWWSHLKQDSYNCEIGSSLRNLMTTNLAQYNIGFLDLIFYRPIGYVHSRVSCFGNVTLFSNVMGKYVGFPSTIPSPFLVLQKWPSKCSANPLIYQNFWTPWWIENGDNSYTFLKIRANTYLAFFIYQSSFWHYVLFIWFNPHVNPHRWVLLISPLDKGRKWVTLVVNGGARSQTQTVWVHCLISILYWLSLRDNHHYDKCLDG